MLLSWMQKKLKCFIKEVYIMLLEKDKTYILEIGYEATIIGTIKDVTANKVHLKNAEVDRGLGKPVYHKIYSIDKSCITSAREW